MLALVALFTGGLLGFPPHDCERLRREHQEPPGKQRDQCQHVEIDPVGARQGGVAIHFRVGSLDQHAGRQPGAQPPCEQRGVDSGTQSQVDAVEQARPGEQRLRGADIDDGEALPARAFEDPGNAQRNHVQPDLHGQRVAGFQSQRSGCGRRHEDPIGAQEIQPVGNVGRGEKQLDPRRPENIEPEDSQRVTLTGNSRFHLQHGAGHRHLGESGHPRVQGFVESGAGTANGQIGLSREHLDRRPEFSERGAVDELHRVAERHAQGNGGERQREPPGVLERGREQQPAADTGERHPPML